MKKKLVMLLVLAVFAFLTACGGGGGGSTTSASNTPSAETPVTPPVVDPPVVDPPVVDPPVVDPPVVTPAGSASLLAFDATGNSYGVIRANGTISVAKTGTDGQEKWRTEVLAGEKFTASKIMTCGSKVYLIAVYAESSSNPNFGDIWQVILDSAGTVEVKSKLRSSVRFQDVTYETGDNFVTMLIEVVGFYQYFQRFNLDGSEPMETRIIDPAWGFQLLAMKSFDGFIYVAGYQASLPPFAERTLIVCMISKDLLNLLYEPQRALSPVNLGYPRNDEFLGWTAASGKFVISGRLQQPDGSYESYLFEVQQSDGSWSRRLQIPNGAKIGPLAADSTDNVFGIQNNAGSYDLTKFSSINQITKLATFTDQVSDIVYYGGRNYVTFTSAQPAVFDSTSGLKLN